MQSSSRGAAIATRAWGDRSSPTLVLIHGGAAHSGWWDLTASFLADRFHVLAPDLTGHGDSEWRDGYDLDTWSDEVAAVIGEHASPRPFLAGHSMGGHVALTLAQRSGEALGGVVTIDSELRRREDPLRPPPWTGADLEQRTVHPDEDTIVSRFRTMPAECRASSAVLHEVARQSVVRSPEGWSWKFDRRFVDHAPLRMEDLAPLACPSRVVRGEHGLVDASMAAAAAARLEPTTDRLAPARVAGAGHHIPLERPRELAAVISATVAEWILHRSPDNRRTR